MMNINELSCRVCLKDQNVLINVYDELEDLSTNLSKLLDTCADLQICEDDPFPKYLCEDCTRELLITSKFREKCVKSKEILCKIMENTKIVDFEELSNSSDIIEYCLESEEGEDTSNLIVQEFTPDENVLLDVSEPVDQVCQLSPTELNKCIELPNQPLLDSFIEEDILTEYSSNQNYLEAEETANVYCNTPVIQEDLSQKNLLCKKQGEKLKCSNIFKCDMCGAQFKHPINLQKHLQKSHEADHCFICNKCSHCFSLETEFNKHVENCSIFKNTSETNSVNKTSNTDLIVNGTLGTECTRKCVYCQRTFPTPFALRMHLRTHTGERPFQCKYCAKSFKTQYQLNVHHKRHTGQADFICTLCNKSFYEQSNLNVHMRSHTGERPHVCSVCHKTFTRVFLLQFHMRIHTGEKPFKCNFCDKYFRQHSDLKNHLTIHTGRKQHNCVLCVKSYTKRSHLVRHVRKHQGHSNPTDTETTKFEDTETTKFDQNQKDLQNFEVSYSLNDITDSNDL